MESTLSLAELAAATDGRVVSGSSHAGFTGVSIDSRTLKLGELFVAITGPRFDGHQFVAEVAAKGAAAAVVHHDVPQAGALPLVRVADTTRALADLARHVRRATTIPVVAITGSMGKTTTKEITAAMLASRGPVLKTEGNFNNQYGLPLSLLRLRPEHTAAVLELGMSAAGELRALSAIAEPDVAVITNVAPVHLEFFSSLDAIAAAKAEVLEGLRREGCAVLNADDPRVRRSGEAHGGRVVWFGRDRRCDVSAENWRGTAFGMRFDLVIEGRSVDVALPLPGPHYVMDFLAAAGVAHSLGLAPEAMAEAATQVRPAPHRGQVLRLRGGVTLIDDAYNASPEAVRAALVALGMAGGKRQVVFLGDMLELGPSGPELHREVGRAVGQQAQLLVAVGAQGGALVEGARSAGLGAEAAREFADSAAAAAAAPSLVAPGDAVLVKGSRGMRMERVVQALVARLGLVDG